MAISDSTRAEQIRTSPDFYERFRIAQAIRAGNLIFVSGQVAIDDEGQIVGVGDFDTQAERAFTNLRRVLEAGGSGLNKIIKVNIYMTDMSKFPTIVELRERFFGRPYPADTIVEVKSLALPELMIEIEAIALAEGEIIG